MVLFNPTIVAGGAEDLGLLRDDLSRALAYSDQYLTDIGRRESGLIYSHFLGSHKDSVAKFEELAQGSRSLLGNAQAHVNQTIKSYAATEGANVDEVKKIWCALQADPGSQPIGSDPTGTAADGPLPSSVLTTPDGKTDHWIWNVLSWPDYLSVGSWVRKVLAWVVKHFGGAEDIWKWLWEWLGGDFEKIADVAEAWFSLSRCFETLSSEVQNRMQIMFTGWRDSSDATAAGSYFTKVVQAFGDDGAAKPIHQLGVLYNDIAWSSFGFFQAIYSCIDAALDGLAALLLGFSSFAEVIAAFGTAGATGPLAVVSAVAAAVQEVSSMWGYMMTAVYAVFGLGALLGAATTDVEWVTLPEG